MKEKWNEKYLKEFVVKLILKIATWNFCPKSSLGHTNHFKFKYTSIFKKFLSKIDFSE